MASVINLFNKLFEGVIWTFISLILFIFLFRIFLRRKYSAVSSLALDYITLLYIVNELPFCFQYFSSLSVHVFSCNTRMIKKTVWPDEKDCTFDVPVNLQNDRVYGKDKKPDIPDKNLSASTNKMSRKLMVSAAISWYGATKPFCERKWY